MELDDTISLKTGEKIETYFTGTEKQNSSIQLLTNAKKENVG